QCRCCLAADAAIGLHLRRDRQQPIEIDRRQIEDRQEVLGEGHRRCCVDHERYSPFIRTYSALRSHVQIVAPAPPPVPRLTSTRRSAFFKYSPACGEFSSRGRPFSNSRMPPTCTVTRFMSKATPDRPAAATMRPQLGSAPCTAVFTSGELAIVRATFRASSRDCASRTFTASSFVAPSPPRTMPIASSRDTVRSASSRAGYDSSSIITPLAPDAIAYSESLVDPSPSTVIAL